MKRSRIFALYRAVRFVREVSLVIRHDRVTVYAAQSSFFIIISLFPFLMLLLGLTQYVLPITEAELAEMMTSLFPDKFDTYIASIANELLGRSSFPVISLSAAAIFWSTSRGVNAVSRGIKNVYGTIGGGSFFREVLQSFLHTTAFIAILILTLAALVFGNGFFLLLESRVHAMAPVYSFLYRMRSLIVFVVLTLFFSLIYRALARPSSPERACTESFCPDVPTRLCLRGAPYPAYPEGTRIPLSYRLIGASFSAAGWMLFSYFYALYLEHFSNASYIYGSLTAVVLFMLWMYFCMIILLCGAELSKFFAHLEYLEKHEKKRSKTTPA